MIKDREAVKRLNLLRTSKTFALREVSKDGSADVVCPPRIPDSDGVYWVSGYTKLKNGRSLESVFRLDTNAGASLLAVFWLIDGKWFQQEDADALSALGVSRADAFPFDWSFAIPVTKDAFHG